VFLAGDAWQLFFDSMERDAFRLETLPVYRVSQEEEAIARFLAGEPMPPEDTAEWAQRLQRYAATGRSVSRVHVLTRPLTDYLRFEFQYYASNVAAGEDVRILDLTKRENPGLPDQDYWILDDSHVVLMHYERDGTQINRELYSGDPEPYRQWKRLALAESVPFKDFVRELG